MALALATGVDFLIMLDGIPNFLDPRDLTQHFAQSMLYLHAQPPISNLVLGLALKLQAFSGIPHERAILAFHIMVGAGVACGFAALASKLILSRKLVAAAIILFVFHPAFLEYTLLFNYPIYESLYLMFIPLLAIRLFRRRHAADLIPVGLAILAMVYTRALFHPLWAIGLLGLLIFLVPRPTRPGMLHHVRRFAPSLILLLALLTAWPLKNWILFRQFNYTSWLGFNLTHNYLSSAMAPLPDAQGLYTPEPLGSSCVRWTVGHAEFGIQPGSLPLEIAYQIAHPGVSATNPVNVRLRVEGRIAADQKVCNRGPQACRIELPPLKRLARIELDIEPTFRDSAGRERGIAIESIKHLGPNGPIDAAIDTLPRIVHGVPESMSSIAVMVKPVKSCGGINYNHYWMFDYSRRGIELTVDALMRHPALLWEKIRANYLFFTRFTGRNPLSGSLYGKPSDSFLKRWNWMYETLLCQDFRPESRLVEGGLTSYWPASGFMLTFPMLLGLSIVKTARQKNRRPLRARLACIMLFNIIWVLAMALFIDGLESNRMRFSTMPYLIILGFWLVPASGRASQGSPPAARRRRTASIPR